MSAPATSATGAWAAAELPGAFRFVGSSFETALSEGSELTDVQRTTYTAEPSGVTFAVTVASGDDMVAQTQQQAERIASAFNTAFETAGVESMYTGQDVNPAGNVSDVVFIAVSSTSGRSQTQIRVPLAQVQNGDITAEVAEARAQLDQLEGS